ncbi:MAG: hypothetical protein IJW16_02145 [Clostridia bacterium]|nr:hypothetical protein [Clostridia bacterium]
MDKNTQKDKLVAALYRCDPIKERDLDDEWKDGEVERIAERLLELGVVVIPMPEDPEETYGDRIRRLDDDALAFNVMCPRELAEVDAPTDWPCRINLREGKTGCIECSKQFVRTKPGKPRREDR